MVTIIDKFIKGEPFKAGKYETKDKKLFYSGNCVAFIKEGTGLWVDSCGWKTNTTRNLLNSIPDIEVKNTRGNWTLNDIPWEGELINITEFLKNDNITSN